MKKVLSALLIIAMVICLCSCANADDKYTIHCNDGTVKQMTPSQIIDMYKNDQRNYEELLDGALISGTGVVRSVEGIKEKGWSYPEKTPTAWGQDINIGSWNVVVSTFFAPQDNHEQLYNGDKVSFQGILYVDSFSYAVTIHVHYEQEETYVKYVG